MLKTILVYHFCRRKLGLTTNKRVKQKYFSMHTSHTRSDKFPNKKTLTRIHIKVPSLSLQQYGELCALHPHILPSSDRVLRAHYSRPSDIYLQHTHIKLRSALASATEGCFVYSCHIFGYL